MISTTKSRQAALSMSFSRSSAASTNRMLHPRPVVADGVQDRLRAGAVGEVGGVRLTISARPSASTYPSGDDRLVGGVRRR
jgi:hypothetical protein